MAVKPEGTPCWADAMFADVEAAKSFYGDVLGWTFAAPQAEFGDYTQAYVDGRAVAAVSPVMPGMEGGEASWCLYLASADLEATAARVRENGGEVVLEPMEVADFGAMLLAKDAGGAVFGVWRAGTHEGFDTTDVPGAYCWAEVFSREPARSDAFFPAVFPYRLKRVEDDTMDYTLFTLDGEEPVLGRMVMGEEFPAGVPSYLAVYFGVEDCDAAVAKATERGAALHFGPMDTPFGRFAALGDPQGAAFSVIDVSTVKGEMPVITDVS